MAKTKPAAEEHDRAVDEDGQPFLSHLLELRQRLLRSVLAVAILFFPIYYFANSIYEFVAAPLMANLPAGSGMIATEVASPFMTPFKLAAYSAVFAAMPYMLHQAWAFVSPGLYLREKTFALPLLVSSIALFYLGMTFAYFIVFPLVFQFFAGVTPVGVTMMTDINKYLDFVIKMFFAFGFSFEIPIATFLLVSSGISSTASLKAKRPYVIVGCFVVGMLLTPPDVISQVLLAVPMWMLFELGVWFAQFAERRAKAADEATTPEET
ncbi:MAG: twin-arginine translocase subunit TatC [Gammaproteobacteria bacterium]|nr:twin-arginine translocase subunit TatC [Gammaproteobacteria bacterium]